MISVLALLMFFLLFIFLCFSRLKFLAVVDAM